MDPLIGSALISSVLGGIFGLGTQAYSAKQQDVANKQNLAEAQRNREFQMASYQNQHQWEVADLKKAGLNPILSANSGSGSLSGGMGTVQSTAKDVAQNLGTSLLGSQISLNSAKSKTEKRSQDLMAVTARREAATAKLTEATALRERMQAELDKLSFSAISKNWKAQAIQQTLRQLGLPMFKGLSIKN